MDGERIYHASQGKKGETVKRANMRQHYRVLEDGEIDMYVNAQSGVFKVCIAGDLCDDKEVIFNGIDKSGNEDGWVPAVTFGHTSNSIKVRISRIDEKFYCESLKIEWN